MSRSPDHPIGRHAAPPPPFNPVNPESKGLMIRQPQDWITCVVYPLRSPDLPITRSPDASAPPCPLPYSSHFIPRSSHPYPGLIPPLSRALGRSIPADPGPMILSHRYGASAFTGLLTAAAWKHSSADVFSSPRKSHQHTVALPRHNRELVHSLSHEVHVFGTTQESPGGQCAPSLRFGPQR